MAINYKRELPIGSLRIATGCQYCAVGCGYNALLVPTSDNSADTTKEKGVSRFITPAMQSQHPIKFKGTLYKAAVTPDVNCDLNKGNHSVRGGSQGGNLVTAKVNGTHPDRSTRERITSPMVRIDDGTYSGKLVEITWETLNKVMAKLLIQTTEMEKTEVDGKEKLATNRPEALGVKLYEYQYLENTYAATRLFYSAIGTPNLAYHDRPSAQGSSPGVGDAGFGPHDFSYDDVRDSDLIFFIGSNPYENQSVFFMQNCVGKEIIVLDPRATATAQYADQTDGLHLQPKYLGADSLVLYAIARALIEKHGDDNGDFPHHPKIASDDYVNELDLEDYSKRQKSRVMSFNQFCDFLGVPKEDPDNLGEIITNDIYTLQNASESSGIAVEALQECVDRLYAHVATKGYKPKIGIIYEKGLIWGYNYHNTAAVASLGMLLGGHGESGCFTGRAGGHQKGWSESKEYLENFIQKNDGKPKLGYPFHNASDTYSDDLLKAEFGPSNSTLTIKHNLDNHLFGPPGDQIVENIEKSNRVRLKNGLETVAEPDVHLLWIIGSNYFGQNNDAATKRNILKERLEIGGSEGNVLRSSSTEIDEIIETLGHRIREKGLVMVHQEIFTNPTTELCDIIIPAAGWGEDTFCRYNAERRLKLYERFQDMPLHDVDEAMINSRVEKDPMVHIDDFKHSPKPDWRIIKGIVKEISTQIKLESITDGFDWNNSSELADAMAKNSNRTGWLEGLIKFGNDTVNSAHFDLDDNNKAKNIVHTILGKKKIVDAKKPDHISAVLATSYEIPVEKGGTAGRNDIYGNGIATNGVHLPVNVKKDDPKMLQGTMSIKRDNDTFFFVKAPWKDIQPAFEALKPTSDKEVIITNGRFNHLWNNMFHHLRNDSVSERYPEDMPGTIIEFNPTWAAQQKIKNGDVVVVKKLDNSDIQFKGIASLQASILDGAAFAMFSYPVKNNGRFNFDGMSNNITDGYSDGINAIAALKYGKGIVEKTGVNYESVIRSGPTYEQRNRIAGDHYDDIFQLSNDSEHARLDWKMRELIVTKGLPRAFVHTSNPERPNSFLDPDKFFMDLYNNELIPPKNEKRLRDEFAGLVKYMSYASIDKWDGVDLDLANEWIEHMASLGQPDPDDPQPENPEEPQPGVPEEQMIALLKAKQSFGASMHSGVPASEVSLSTLFQNENYKEVLEFLKKGKSKTNQKPLIVPKKPEDSMFYTQVKSGVMQSFFNDQEREIIKNWINSLTINEPMNMFEKVIKILDDSVGGPDASVSMHGAFWRDKNRDQFVEAGVMGQQLIILENGAESILIKALKGEAPFGADIGTPGASFRRMPADKPPVSAANIALIEKWINDNCPE